MQSMKEEARSAADLVRRRESRTTLVRELRDIGREMERAAADQAHHEVSLAIRGQAVTLFRAANIIEAETPEELH